MTLFIVDNNNLYRLYEEIYQLYDFQVDDHVVQKIVELELEMLPVTLDSLRPLKEKDNSRSDHIEQIRLSEQRRTNCHNMWSTNKEVDHRNMESFNSLRCKELDEYDTYKTNQKSSISNNKLSNSMMPAQFHHLSNSTTNPTDLKGNRMLKSSIFESQIKQNGISGQNKYPIQKGQTFGYYDGSSVSRKAEPKPKNIDPSNSNNYTHNDKNFTNNNNNSNFINFINNNIITDNNNSKLKEDYCSTQNSDKYSHQSSVRSTNNISGHSDYNTRVK